MYQRVWSTYLGIVSLCDFEPKATILPRKELVMAQNIAQQKWLKKVVATISGTLCRTCMSPQSNITFWQNLKHIFELICFIVVIAARCRALFFIPTFSPKSFIFFGATQLDVFYEDHHRLSKTSRKNAAASYIPFILFCFIYSSLIGEAAILLIIVLARIPSQRWRWCFSCKIHFYIHYY